MFKILFAAALTTSVNVKSAPGITAVYDAKKKTVHIKWQQSSMGIKSFIVQRSEDNFNWKDIALIANLPSNSIRTYQFNDEKPGAGENYYRLKSISEKNQLVYSKSIMVITSDLKHSWVMYPVPVTNVLTLQYKGTEKIKGVINIIIQHISGKILTRIRSSSLNTVIQIPVSNLGRGIYDIRIIIEDEITWNQRFVK